MKFARRGGKAASGEGVSFILAGTNNDYDNRTGFHFQLNVSSTDRLRLERAALLARHDSDAIAPAVLAIIPPTRN